MLGQKHFIISGTWNSGSQGYELGLSRPIQETEWYGWILGPCFPEVMQGMSSVKCVLTCLAHSTLFVAWKAIGAVFFVVVVVVYCFVYLFV